MSCVIFFPAASGRRPGAEPTALAHPNALEPPQWRRLPLHDAVAQSRRLHRGLVSAAGQWAMARGLSLPADHVALWAAAAGSSGLPGDVDGVTGPWLASGVQTFVWSTVWAWCARAGCLPPADLARSLRLLYGFLADSGRLHPGSDPLPELDAALGSADPGLRDRLEPTTSPGPAAA